MIDEMEVLINKIREIPEGMALHVPDMLVSVSDSDKLAADIIECIITHKDRSKITIGMVDESLKTAAWWWHTIAAAIHHEENTPKEHE